MKNVCACVHGSKCMCVCVGGGGGGDRERERERERERTEEGEGEKGWRLGVGKGGITVTWEPRHITSLFSHLKYSTIIYTHHTHCIALAHV